MTQGRPHKGKEAFLRARFGALREALHGEPSKANWRTITRLVTAWHGEAFEEIIRYTEDHLTRWPDDLRVVLPRWRNRLRRGHATPQARLARTLSVGLWGWPNAYSPALVRLLSSETLSSLRVVEITGSTSAPAIADALTDMLARQPQPLARLALAHFPFHDMPDAQARWRALLQRVRVDTLRVLPLPSSLMAFEEETLLGSHLKTLIVHGGYAKKPENATWLFEAMLPRLEALVLERSASWWATSNDVSVEELLALPAHQAARAAGEIHDET